MDPEGEEQMEGVSLRADGRRLGGEWHRAVARKTGGPCWKMGGNGGGGASQSHPTRFLGFVTVVTSDYADHEPLASPENEHSLRLMSMCIVLVLLLIEEQQCFSFPSFISRENSTATLWLHTFLMLSHQITFPFLTSQP